MIGFLVAVVGLVLLVGERFGWLGRLPGDIVVRRGNFTFYFPLATCLAVSAVVTLTLWILHARR